jgi:hypothetical protein
MGIFAGLKGTVNVCGQIALVVILIVAFYKITIAYIHGQAINSLVKKFIGSCIFIGSATGLVELSVFIGQSLVGPLKTIITSLVNSIANSF